MDTNHVRTNVVLDEELIRKAQRLTGIKTKKQVIHAALEVLVHLSEQAQIRELRGKLTWEGNLDELRVDPLR